MQDHLRRRVPQRHFDDIATFREGLGGTMKYLWASWQNITDLDPRKWTVPSQIYQNLVIFLVHHHHGLIANFHNTCSATEKRWRDLRSCDLRSSMTILSIPGISLSNSSYSWYRDGLARSSLSHVFWYFSLRAQITLFCQRIKKKCHVA